MANTTLNSTDVNQTALIVVPVSVSLFILSLCCLCLCFWCYLCCPRPRHVEYHDGNRVQRSILASSVTMGHSRCHVRNSDAPSQEAPVDMTNVTFETGSISTKTVPTAVYGKVIPPRRNTLPNGSKPLIPAILPNRMQSLPDNFPDYRQCRGYSLQS